MNLNDWATKIYNQNVEAGWWNDPDRCQYQTLQLVSTEVAEATEGARKSLKDDHLPQYDMELVELADALIRVLDYGGRYRLEYEDLDLDYPLIGKDKTAGSNHIQININLVDFVKAIYMGKSKDVLNNFYSALLGAIIKVANSRGYSFNLLIKVMKEKCEYNKKRSDHKLENRNKENGKKF